MSKPTYTPRANTLPCSVVNFFRSNDDEQLTVDDIAEKFDVGRANVHTQLALALEAHLLARKRNDDGEYIYTAGKALNAAEPVSIAESENNNSLRSSATAPAIANNTRDNTREHPPIDTSKVVIESGVPVSGRQTGKTQALRDLMDRLKPGDSCALPRHAQPSLVKLMSLRHSASKQKFVCRAISPDQIRLWRTA